MGKVVVVVVILVVGSGYSAGYVIVVVVLWSTRVSKSYTEQRTLHIAIY